MKTTNMKENEAFSDNAKKANRWFNETAESVLDLYREQMNAVSNYYGKVFSSFVEGNRRMFNPFDLFNSGEGNRAESFGAKGNGFADLYLNTIERSFRRMNDYGQDMVDAVNRQMENENSDWSSFGRSQQEQFTNSAQAMQRSLDVFFEVTERQIGFAADMNQQMRENMSRGIDLMMKQNERFWSELVNNNNNTAQKNAAKAYAEDGEKQAVKKREKVEEGQQ